MQIPNFPECDHEIVQSLFHLSDQELISLFKRYPGSGRYFTAIFCRYSPIVYSLIRHSARSPVQADYLFALTWRHILHELGGLDWPDISSEPEDSGSQAKQGSEGQRPASLQSWIINVTALCINQAAIPDVESIHYSIKEASPPFWCYVEQALDQLPPVERLMVLMSRTFRWSETRIAAYLQAEGEQISPAEVRERLQVAYRNLEAVLPQDIRAIYLGEWTDLQPMADLSEDSLDSLLAVPDLMTVTSDRELG
ncbi:MAG: sigma-70 family RNA polymerase sigma factor [Cyanobacteria bacterium Co-bin13]|nr:sigma-70 family RNA polymerase sigma factor [Cyanobacteria bacterium Co-bin13]